LNMLTPLDYFKAFKKEWADRSQPEEAL